MKAYIIIAHTGQEIIDTTPEAQERIDAMKYHEERMRRKRKRIVKEKRKRERNPLTRVACLFGLM